MFNDFKPPTRERKRPAGVAVGIRAGLHQAVDTEMAKAVVKHGGMQTPAGGTLSDEECLVILVEEIGEVARAMTYDEGDPAKMDAELVQVGTMALAWLEGRLLKREAAEGAATGKQPLCADSPCVIHEEGYENNWAPAIKVFDKLKEDTGEFSLPCYEGPVGTVHRGGCGGCQA